jgi:hypothetical protein
MEGAIERIVDATAASWLPNFAQLLEFRQDLSYR